MNIDFKKTKSLMTKIGSGVSLFDKSLSGQIAGMGSRVNSLAASIRGLNIPNASSLASNLQSKLNSQALTTLSTHVSENMDGMLGRISTFSSFCSMEDAIGGVMAKAKELPEVIPDVVPDGLVPLSSAKDIVEDIASAPSAVTENLPKAFGAMMSGRGMITATDRVTMAISKVGAIQHQVASTEALVVSTQAAFDRGEQGVTAQYLEEVKSLRDESVALLMANNKVIEDGAKELSEHLDGIDYKIAAETEFFSGATTKLTQFTDALKVQSLFSGDPVIKSVIGSLGSDDLLAELNKPDTLNPNDDFV